MSVRSLNKVMLIGNLTRDPELRYTPAGTAVVTFSVATNRSWTTEAGEKKEEVEFHRIVAWNKLAELCSQLLTKGRKVFVEGRLQTRSWTGQDGNQRQSTEIVIDDMIILDSRRPDLGVLPRVTPVNMSVAPVGVKVQVDESIVSPKTASTIKPKSTKKTDIKEEKQVNTETNKKTEDISPDDIPF